MPEHLAAFQYQRGRQLDDLRVGRLGELLVRELHPYLVDVETDVRPVLHGEVYEEVVAHGVDVVQPHRHAVDLGRHVAYLRGRVPDTPCEAYHLCGGHRDRRVVVGVPFPQLYLLVRHRLPYSCRVEQRVLRAVAFRHDGHDGKHLAVLVPALFRFQADDVVYGLVARHFLGGDVHEAYRLRSRDDRRNLLVHRQLFHLLVSRLRFSFRQNENARQKHNAK